jgi:tetratricopeptide (TPR) repeat protein
VIEKSDRSSGNSFVLGIAAGAVAIAISLLIQKEECLEQGRIYETKELNEESGQGEQLAKEGLYVEAIRSFDKAIEGKSLIESSAVAAVLLKKGNAFYNLDRFNQAIEFYDQATNLKPDLVEAILNKGNSLINLRRYDEAGRYFQNAIDTDERDYTAWWGKGQSLFYQEKYDEAIRCYNKAIEIKPSDILWYNKGLAFHANGKYESALDCYEEARRINPNSVLNLTSLAEVLLILKRYDDFNTLIDEIRAKPESESYKFAVDLMTICCLYLTRNENEGTKRTMDLLNYYESNFYQSISTKSNSDMSLTDEWTFNDLKKSIELTDFENPDAKELIVSLLGLTKAKTVENMITAIQKARELVKLMPSKGTRSGRLLSLVKQKEINETDLKVVNTSRPIEGRQGWYNWEIHIEAPDDVLKKIKNVTYLLHPTFYEPKMTVSQPEGGFKFESNGWGEFKVRVDIVLKQGPTIKKSHWLNLTSSALFSGSGS